MDAELCGNETAQLAFLKRLEAVLVLFRQVAGVVPTHIAIALDRTRILRVFLHRIDEVKLAGVELVEHFLSSCFIIGIEQDMRGTLGTVVRGRVHLGVLQHVSVAGIFVGGERCVQLVLLELLLYFSAIAIFGHSRLIERGLPLLVGVVVRLRLVDLLVDLGALDGDVLLLDAFLQQLALGVGIEHFFTHGSRGVIVLRKPCAPRIFIVSTQLLAHALDVVGDGVFGDFHTVDRARHTAGARRNVALARASGQTPCACSRQTDRAHGLHDVRFLHMNLPSNMGFAIAPPTGSPMR